MEKIGFIGVGIMGKPMSKNLIKAGYGLVVLDIDKDAVDDVVAEGAASANTAKEIAEQSDIVITMLPDSPDVEQVVFGPDGVLEGLKPDQLFIDMSTIAPATSQKIYKELQKKQVEALARTAQFR